MTVFAFIQDEGLTFGEVISNIPHDAAAIVIYVLIAVFIGFIWRGSRSSNAPPEATPPAEDADNAGTRPPQHDTRTSR